MSVIKRLGVSVVFMAATAPAILSSFPVVAADLTDGASVPEANATASSTFDDGRFGGIAKSLSNWNVIVGAGIMYRPKYEGSKDMEIAPIPLVSATFGDRVHVDPSGVTVDAISTDGFTLGIKGGYDLGRKESDSDHLRGLGNIDAGGIIGAKLAYQYGPASIYADVNRIIGGSEGLTGTFGADLSTTYDRFMLSAGASATVADSNYMQSYFGVTSQQAARSGLQQYDAKAGLKRFDVDASVTYMATRNWLIRGQVGIGFLAGDAKDSPVTERTVQPSAMLAVGYKF